MQTEFIHFKKEIPFSKIVLYIFIPPLLTMILYVFFSLIFNQVIPTMLLFFISALLVLFPIQLFIILKASKKDYGKYSLKTAFENQKKHPLWLIILLGMICFGFAGLMTLTIMPLEHGLFSSLSERLFGSIPSYFNWRNLEILSSYPKTILIITGILYFILNGFVGPIVEELFFRGFLTPRLKINNWLAPLLMTVLFSIYHYWLPFDNIFRIVAFFPAFYLAWHLKNIKISIIFHCLSNIFTATMFMITILSI
jgi:uncharacterized protein